MQRPRWKLAALIGLIAALACAARAEAQVRVDATISPAAARVGDVVVLDVNIITNGPAPDAINVPALPPGLRVTGSNDYTEYELRMPGGRRRTTRRELTVTTVAAGHFIIPPIAVRIEGRVYRSRPLRLDVAPGVIAGPPGESSGGPDDEVLLQSWATPDTVYVGQQVTVRADALFSADVRSRLAGAPQYDAPSAAGFWVYDLPGNQSAEYRPIRGRTYEVQTFRRAFFPLNSGTLIVPGAHLTYAVRRGFLSGPENYDLRSDSFRVVVEPLPANGRPPAFAGAVGRYTATAHVEPSSVATGEAATLTVEVSGDGNIKALPPPHLPALTGVQVFSPAEDSEVRPDDETVGGSKRFTWVLVPSRPGQLVIPTLELPYFDPAQRRYQIARTEPLTVGVIPGSDQGTGVAGANAVAALRPLHARDEGPGVAPFVRSPAFGVMAATPLLALLGLGLARRRRRTRPTVRPRAGSAMLDRLRGEAAALRARAAGGGSPESDSGGDESAGERPPGSAEADGVAAAPLPAGVPAELLGFMRSWLAERLGVPELEETPVTRLDGALRDAGVRATVAAGIAGLAGRLERARFTPTPPSRASLQAWIEEAERLLTETHDGATRRTRGGRSGAAVVVALLLAGTTGQATAAQAAIAPRAPSASAPGGWIAAATPGVLPAGAAGDSAFGAAVSAYRAGHFSDAAALFEAYARANPSHASAWYDLGNAAFRAGDRGRAIWAWLRALELRPRDGDIRQNLALAGADPAVVNAATPVIAASQDELLLAAGLLWLLGAGLLVAWRIRPLRSFTMTGGVAVALAVVLGLFAVSARLGRPAAVLTDAVTLRGGPNIHADSVGELKEAAPVRVLERRDAWVRVQDASGEGQDGWAELGRVGAL